MIKAVRYDDCGRQVALSRRATAVYRPSSGHSEQDMEEVWSAVVETVRSVVPDDGTVDFVAITGQGDGCWLVDEAGDPTGPAVLWNDGRAASIVEAWRRDGTLEEAFRINGSIGFSGLPHAILTWLKDSDPDRIARSAYSLTCDGFLFGRMTGRAAVDSSDAAVPFLDVRTGAYSHDLLSFYSLEWASRLLPPILGDTQRVRGLRPEVSAEVGLLEGTPVVIAPYDIVSTAIGVGAVEPGDACGILGTTLCVEVITDTVDTDGVAGGLTIPLQSPDLFVRAFPTLAGTEVIDWTVGVLLAETPGQLADLASGAPPGSGGLTFLPYLSPAGERAPFLDTTARGSFHGLSFEHGPEHLSRSVLEGLTMVVQDCLEASPTVPSALGLSGGGARSDFWCSLIADMTGVPVRRTADEEVGARGAYVYGLMAVGANPDLRTAVRSVEIVDEFYPDPDVRAIYNDLRSTFMEIRGAESGTAWRELHRFRGISDG